MSFKPSFKALAALTALAGALLFALPALAAPVTLFTASDFYVPRPAANSDQVGVERLLATFDLAANGFADLIGQECFFSVTASNGDSVHANNHGVLTTNGAGTDVNETESQPNVDTTQLEDETLVLGPTVELYNVMLADANGIVATSVDYTVTVDCEVTTTTTAPTTTTTTAPTTTTTDAGTTSTTIPTVTTSVLGVTTTTAPQVDTTSTTVPSVSQDTLPFTGSPVEVAGVAMAAVALLMLGSGALMASRDR